MARLVPAIAVWNSGTKHVDARAFASRKRRRRDKRGTTKLLRD
jgi:hypothetical protein